MKIPFWISLIWLALFSYAANTTKPSECVVGVYNGFVDKAGVVYPSKIIINPNGDNKCNITVSFKLDSMTLAGNDINVSYNPNQVMYALNIAYFSYSHHTKVNNSLAEFNGTFSNMLELTLLYNWGYPILDTIRI
jgi:hypothetical protein